MVRERETTAVSTRHDPSRPLKNPRHEQFVQLIATGKTPAEAFVAVGFSETGASTCAARLLRNAPVRARLEQIRNIVSAATVTRAAVDRDWVLKTLKTNVQRSMQVQPVLNSKGEETGEYRYDGATANRALELIGKELGMFVDRHDHKLQWDGDLTKLTQEQLARLMVSLEAMISAGEAPQLGPVVDVTATVMEEKP